LSKKQEVLYRIQFRHDKLGIIQFFAKSLDLYSIPLIHAEEICQDPTVISKFLRKGESVRFSNFSGTKKVTFPYYQLVLAEELEPVPNNNLKPIKKEEENG